MLANKQKFKNLKDIKNGDHEKSMTVTGSESDWKSWWALLFGFGSGVGINLDTKMWKLCKHKNDD